MNINHHQENKKGSFHYDEKGETLAEMTYSAPKDDRIIIEHTEVDPSLRGKGIGKALIEESVKWARKNNVKVVPECRFAKKILTSSSSYQDVL